MTPELDAKLSALLDEELPDEEAASLCEEIARRPELAERLAELAAVDAELRALPERPLPVHLRSRLGARIHAERTASGRSAPPPRRRRWLPAAALAAAAAAVALVVLPRLRTDPGTEVAVQQPEPTPGVVAQREPEADLERLAADLLEPSPAPPDELGDEDLAVIAVLDVLAELDELEGAG